MFKLSFFHPKIYYNPRFKDLLHIGIKDRVPRYSKQESFAFVAFSFISFLLSIQTMASRFCVVMAFLFNYGEKQTWVNVFLCA